ncbi:MAG: biosynthetic peptidoglycan transglycosylase [Spirochaetia bacterium]
MRRILVGVGAALVLFSVLALILLRVVNTVILPAAVDRLEAAADDTFGVDLGIGSARLRPFRGLHLQDIGISTADDALRASAETLDVDVDLRGLLRLRRAARTPVPIDAGAVWTTAETLAERQLIPQAITARDIGIVVAATARSRAYRVHLDELGLLHEENDEVIRVQALGSSRQAASAGSPPRQEIAAGLTVAYRERTMDVTLALDRLELPRITLPSASLTSGTASASLSARISPARPLRAAGSVELHDLALDAPVVAAGTIRPLDISYTFAAEYAPRVASAEVPTSVPASVRRRFPRGELAISEGDASINGVEFGLSGLLQGLHSGGPHPASGAPAFLPRIIRLTLDLPPTSTSRLHAAVPRALQGPLGTMELQGSFRWRLDLEVPRYNPGGLQWKAETRLRDFAVLHIDESVSPFGLNGSFMHTIRDPEIDYVRRVRIPPAESAEDASARPGTPAAGARGTTVASAAVRASAPRDPTFTYVRLEELSPWVARAVLTAEDGEFYYHNGVNFRTMAQAAVRNLDAGGIVLGASTISMQLVKMLFLDDDRVFSRKLQEVFLVYLMEHEVPVSKDRILEIYLNIAEFGPGVFGIHDAARYYFDAAPGELTAGEATFLASILPAPKRYHWYYERGGITDGWFIRMKSYYDIMLERDRMTPEEYAEAMEERPAFVSYRER